MTRKVSRGLLVLLLAGFGSSAVFAQQDGPAGIVMEPFVLYPGLDLAAGYDDNLFTTQTNQRSSPIYIVSPWVRLEGKPTPHRFDLSFRGDIGRYSDSSNDNYEDYYLLANGLAVITGRLDLKAHAEYIRGHDPRGSTDRPSGTEPDIYDNTGADATIGYGAPGAAGRLELNGGYYTREYQNNRIFTAASDRDTTIAGGTFLWRIAPRTQILAQVDWRSIDYNLATSTLDSEETRIYVGAKWEATAQTTGSVRIGNLKKDFDSNTRQDFSGPSWDVNVRWSPLTYSYFDFLTSRQTNESTGVGDTIVTNLYSLTWVHNWSSRIRTGVLGSWRHDDFRGVGVTREDDTGTLGLRVQYQFRRWLRFGADYTYTDRDSNDGISSYKRNFFLLTVAATL